MTSGNGLSEIVRQGIEHGVMRMNARQTVLLELLGNDGHQLLHSRVVVGPIADNLQAMRQIAIGIGKIGLELQCRSVGLNGLGDVARVLVNRREIRVGVGKGRIYLYGPCVALQCTLYVLHLLEGVAHVGVGIGECRLNANCLLVVHQRLVEFALLLQHRRQIAVCSGEFREDLQRFQVEPRCLLDVSLLTFYVGL